MGVFLSFRESCNDLRGKSLHDNIYMYYVYVLENQKTRGFYIVYTNNLKRRVSEHLSGKSGKTTMKDICWKLISYESYIDQSDATGREKFLKGGSGRKYIVKQLSNYLKR